MSEHLSITVSKELMQALQTPVCCSKSKSTCLDNDFCSSKPSTWPVVKGHGGKLMVKLAYPDSDGDGMPGVEEFCDAYIDWNAHAGCGAIQIDIAEPLTFAEDSEMNLSESQFCYGNRVLEKLNAIIAGRCPMLYDKANGKPKLVAEKIEDLNNITDFCLDVKKAKKSKTDWWGIVKSGGIFSFIVFLFWIFRIIVRAVKGAKGNLEDASYVTKGLSEVLNTFASSMKNLFTVSVPNVAKVLWYAVSFGWLRGKRTPELKIPDEKGTTTTASGHVGNDVQDKADLSPLPDLSKIHPDAGVMLDQLSSLGNNGSYAEEKKHLASLSETGKLYLADLAISEWKALDDAEKIRYLQKDSNRLEGSLPAPFLAKIMRKYLRKPDMVKLLETSAEVWKRRGGRKRLNGSFFYKVQPVYTDVQSQFAAYPAFQKMSQLARDYVTLYAIVMWNELDGEEKQSFMSDTAVIPGQLPSNFVRMIRKQLGLKGNVQFLEDKAALFLHLKSSVKRASWENKYMFSRVEHMYKAWNMLTEEVRSAFEKISGGKDVGRSNVAAAYMEYVGRFMEITSALRLPVSSVEEDGRALESLRDVTYSEFPLWDVADNLVKLNKLFNKYPVILELRAKMIVDAWKLLPDSVRRVFVVKNGNILDTKQIPMEFVEFIHTLTPGIGVKARTNNGHHDHDIDPDKLEGGGGCVDPSATFSPSGKNMISTSFYGPDKFNVIPTPVFQHRILHNKPFLLTPAMQQQWLLPGMLKVTPPPSPVLLMNASGYAAVPGAPVLPVVH